MGPDDGLFVGETDGRDEGVELGVYDGRAVGATMEVATFINFTSLTLTSPIL